jgi:hypothetical protein
LNQKTGIDIRRLNDLGRKALKIMTSESNDVTNNEESVLTNVTAKNEQSSSLIKNNFFGTEENINPVIKPSYTKPIFHSGYRVVNKNGYVVNRSARDYSTVKIDGSLHMSFNRSNSAKKNDIIRVFDKKVKINFST